MAQKGDITKDRILTVGAEIVYRKGYNNTGIQEILKAAGVPKGSFYFYFPSKDKFGAELVNHIAQSFASVSEKTLRNHSLQPHERLEKFFDHFITVLKGTGCSGGCPIGNLAQEMGDLSEGMRVNLFNSIDKLEDLILKSIEELDVSPPFFTGLDKREVAAFILNYWQGAVLRAKVSKSIEPLNQFKKIIFVNMFKV